MDRFYYIDTLEDALYSEGFKCKRWYNGTPVNENDEITTVSFQSGQMTMAMLFEKFHVNRARMPLYCFMVDDGFGNGRNVFYSIAEENSMHLLHIIQTFKSFNPLWSNIHVIVIDKDFTELPALEQEFPQASVLFCQFHVIKYF